MWPGEARLALQVRAEPAPALTAAGAESVYTEPPTHTFPPGLKPKA